MSNKLPAGDYYIGDPCYVISGEEWQEFLGPYWDLDNGGIFSFKEFMVCAFPTQWGDGCYETSNGAMLGVDAAMIGAVPLSAIASGDPTSGIVEHFDKPFECTRDGDGRLHFGHVSVMTGDEEDECSECGHAY